MQILVLVAGTNEPGNAEYLTDRFIDGLRESGATVTKERLRDYELQHFTLRHYDSAYPHEEAFLKLQKACLGAQGIVIASPVWNFSVPSHLKNFIDRMGSFALDGARVRGALKGKPFFFLFTGGAPTSAWKGLLRRTTSHIPQAIRYFGGSVIGQHFEGKCTLGPGKFGLVLDKRPQAAAAVRKHAVRFAQVVRDYAATGKLPVREALLTRVYAFGQSMLKKLS